MRFSRKRSVLPLHEVLPIEDRPSLAQKTNKRRYYPSTHDNARHSHCPSTSLKITKNDPYSSAGRGPHVGVCRCRRRFTRMKPVAIIVVTRGGGGGGGGSARGGGLLTAATCHKRLVTIDLSLHPYDAKADQHAGLSPVMLRFRRTQTGLCKSHHASHVFVGHPGHGAHSAGATTLRGKGGSCKGFYPDACSSQCQKFNHEGKRERRNATMKHKSRGL